MDRDWRSACPLPGVMDSSGVSVIAFDAVRRETMPMKKCFSPQANDLFIQKHFRAMGPLPVGGHRRLDCSTAGSFFSGAGACGRGCGA
jgi:hypothetical protein